MVPPHPPDPPPGAEFGGGGRGRAGVGHFHGDLHQEGCQAIPACASTFAPAHAGREARELRAPQRGTGGRPAAASVAPGAFRSVASPPKTEGGDGVAPASAAVRGGRGARPPRTPFWGGAGVELRASPEGREVLEQGEMTVPARPARARLCQIASAVGGSAAPESCD
eukprot:gene19233-biopygen14549